MLLLIALSSFATIALAVVAIVQRPMNPVRARALALGSDEVTTAPNGGRPAGDRLLRPAARAIAQILPHTWLQRLDRLLVTAGEPIALGSFLVLWASLFIGAVALGLLLSIWAALAFGFLGGYGPLFWLRRSADERKRRIARETPDAVDLLVTCLEAGLGLDGAMIRVGEASTGPLGDEIRRTLREISIGRPRQDALLDLAARSGVAELEGIIRPIVQAERSGVSIGAALRIQADALRVRRRQRAQEHAQRIPAKMTLVMAAFFIPTVMLVAIAPAVFRLIDFFGGGWQP
jgi:tight adherence protein C